MRIEVDEPRLTHVAAAVDTAATAVAAAGLTDLALNVGAAMPGSRATSAAALVATAVGDAVTALTRDLAEHADALGEAALRYGDTERALAAAASR
jgi:predicted lipoprotein